MLDLPEDWDLDFEFHSVHCHMSTFLSVIFSAVGRDISVV